MCFLWVISNSVSAQIYVSGNTTLSISENTYIYTEKEIVGNHNAVTVYKENSIILVANSTPSPKEKPVHHKQNVLDVDSTHKHVTKNVKAKTGKPAYKITSQPISEKFSSTGAESTLAVVIYQYKELGITAQTFFIEKNIYNTEKPDFDNTIHYENNHFSTTHKTRPPPLSC